MRNDFVVSVLAATRLFLAVAITRPTVLVMEGLVGVCAECLAHQALGI